MKKLIFVAFLVDIAFSQSFDINLKHIDYLVEKVVMDADTVAIIHIYSNYPDYKYVPALGEGIACVDDATRASVAYLMHYERFRDQHSLNQAKLLLKFTLKMQAEDGGFYNFVYEDLSINKFGQTSNNDSFKWWACRALWAMGYAYNIFSKFNVEKEFKDTLAVRIERALSKAIRTINKSDIYELFINWKVPAQGYWLLENGADASAEAVIGASLYYEFSKSEKAKWVVEKLCKAISTYQFGDEDDFPFGMHPSFTPNLYIWHSWGSRQSYALLIAGKIFNRADWIESARREIDNFYKKMLLSFDLTDIKPYPERGDQINYGIAPIVQAFIEYGKITGDTTYRMFGGLYGSWWLGNNIANYPVYDSATGRFYDAVKADGTMNLNSGAESVSEGLIGLQTALYDDIASRYLFYKTKSDNSYKIIEAENFASTYGDPKKIYLSEFNWANISKGCLVELKNEDGIRIKFDIDNVYDDLNFYTIYVQYRKRSLPSGYAGVEIVIDSIYKFYFDMSGSSSQDYIWIDRINGSFPLHSGEHTIDVYFRGVGDFVWIDYFIIQPIVERKIFQSPDGAELKVERAVITGIKERGSFDDLDDFEVDIFPNPFNRETNVFLKGKGIFKLRVFDICGRKVDEMTSEAGLLKLNFDNNSSGLYFCFVDAGGFSKIKKLILLR
ncbi:Por secretion system C-terminal sorting domain-containing protein [Candidatus Thermokryptus mobilis]|uniref:Por secretion system C-terminal sorting domain-containing protein n=1 Tax=Candidatus Thermokryptus mobilis TaxID=1643428 RepID=A0A0S4N9C4_9BACT|nr:T9SS type A sorting domain-containing protein [Candidatus Thermokryptus mobilis]CUU07895.1 Por secretion system C-terminal sorting domain-containing protein [Candidatus Thermokryptus mobilis]